MDEILQDLRYAARWLARAPGFTAIAVLCLGIGIGLNTTIFSIVNGAILTPYDFTDPDRLVFIEDRRHKVPENESYELSLDNYLDWKRDAKSYVEMGAVTTRSLTLADGEQPERTQGALITHDLFPMLGVRPLMGRLFRADDDQPGAAPVAILSHDLWQRRYGGDPKILGRAITVNGQPHTVVGVMPAPFQFPTRHKLWVPLAPNLRNTTRDQRQLAVYARLAPGVDLASARNEARVFAAALAARHPAENQGWTTHVRSLRDRFLPADVKGIILTQMGAVFCVLLIACANVANLMLARATTRHREIAVRAALGAGRGRIVRQLLTESVMIGLMGGALGVLLAFWGTDLMRAAIQHGDVPYYVRWSVDGRTLLFTLAVSIGSGLLFGLAPALDAARGNLGDSLKSGARGTEGRRARFRSVLVAAEVGLSLVLLVGAALFVRSFLKVQDADMGFDTTRLMTLRVYLGDHAYASDEARRVKVEGLVQRIEGLPGVAAAAASNTVVLEDGGDMGAVVAEGTTVARGEEPLVFYTGVTAHWFRTVGVEIARGRDLTDSEGARRSGVAVVNQAFVDRLWPGGDAIGKRFRFVADSTGHWVTVIGVARDHRVTDVEQRRPEPCAFVPYPYLATPNTGITVRTAGDPAAILPSLRRVIHDADPGIPVFAVRTMEQVRRDASWERPFFGQVFTVFALIAVLLAVIGVYGVISYSVTQRTREIGVRMALGARGADVLRLVVGQGVRLALSGVVVGLAGAFAVTGVIRGALYEISPTDPVSFVGVALLLISVALVASWIPARRAARLEPMRALREE